MALEILKNRSDISFTERQENDFYIGSLLPDSVKDKTASHFRNPRHRGNMVEYPDLEMFLNKYESLLDDWSCLGYYFHLYIDRRFFKEYLPQIITFLNKDGQVVTKQKEVARVRMNRSGRELARAVFYSEDYYYGDYTRMNTYLVERYQLPMELDTAVTNPGIEEVEYADAEGILKELRGYLYVPADDVKKLQVFETAPLLTFLEQAAKEFVERKWFW